MEATLSNGRFERRTRPRVSSTPRLVVASRGCTFWDRWVLRRLRSHGTRRRDPAGEEGDGCETSGRGRTRAYTAKDFASSNTVVVVRPARFTLSSSTARIVVCRSEAKGGRLPLPWAFRFFPSLPSVLFGRPTVPPTTILVSFAGKDTTLAVFVRLRGGSHHTRSVARVFRVAFLLFHPLSTFVFGTSIFVSFVQFSSSSYVAVSSLFFSAEWYERARVWWHVSTILIGARRMPVLVRRRGTYQGPSRKQSRERSDPIRRRSSARDGWGMGREGDGWEDVVVLGIRMGPVFPFKRGFLFRSKGWVGIPFPHGLVACTCSGHGPSPLLVSPYHHPPDGPR